MLVVLLTVASVSAADNITDESLSVEEDENIDMMDECSSVDSYSTECGTDDDNLRFNEIVSNDDSLGAGKRTTYFDVSQNYLHNIFTVKLMSNGVGTGIKSFTYSIDGGAYKSGSTTIKTSFDPYTTHTLILNYDGNSVYESCTKKVNFQVLSSIDFNSQGTYTSGGMNFKYSLIDNDGNSIGSKTIFAPFGTTTLKLYNEKTGQSLSKTVTVKHTIFLDDAGVYTDGGMDFKYTVYNQQGSISRVYTVFAPFGKSIVSVRNNWTGETLTKEVNVKKRILETENMDVDYEDIIEYKVRVADANDNFTSGLPVTFTMGYNTYHNWSDSDGYATLKIHLKAGTYNIDTSYSGLKNTNTIKVNPILVTDDYQNMYIKPLTAYYGQDKELDFGWKGYFQGYLKIYKGKSLYTNIDLDSSGYVGDYITYESGSNSYDFFTYSMSVGTYYAKIIDLEGNIVAQSTIKITKTPTNIKVPSITVKLGKKGVVTATVYEKSCSEAHWEGKVTFKINGKTYNVKIKDGVAKIKIKLPSKIKTYTCKAKFLGDKNAKSSSTKFKIIVKKKITATKKTTTKKKSVTITVPVQLNMKFSKSSRKYTVKTYKWIEYYNGKHAHIYIKIYKNGKKITDFDAKYYVHYNGGGGIHFTYHPYYYEYKGIKYYKALDIGYKNALKADKIKVTIMV